MRRRRRLHTGPSEPWTEAEDAKLRDMIELGLSDDFWTVGLPSRTLREMLDRRLELGIKPAKLI